MVLFGCILIFLVIGFELNFGVVIFCFEWKEKRIMGGLLFFLKFVLLDLIFVVIFFLW